MRRGRVEAINHDMRTNFVVNWVYNKAISFRLRSDLRRYWRGCSPEEPGRTRTCAVDVPQSASWPIQVLCRPTKRGFYGKLDRSRPKKRLIQKQTKTVDYWLLPHRQHTQEEIPNPVESGKRRPGKVINLEIYLKSHHTKYYHCWNIHFHLVTGSYMPFIDSDSYPWACGGPR